MRALKHLTESLEQVDRTVQAKALEAVLHYGINTLPDELLTIIIEMACLPVCENELDRIPAHLRVGAVCRRFRQITLRLPALWSEIGFAKSQEWTALQLERSRCNRVDVAFTHYLHEDEENLSTLCAEEGACAGYWKEIVKHHHRLRTLILHNYHSGDVINTCLMDLTLPCLEELLLDLGNNWEENPNTIAVKSWVMPSLKRLTCGDCMINSALTHPLESLTLYIGMNPSCNAHDLLRFLSSPVGKNLHKLDVTFFGRESDIPLDPAPPTVEDLPTARLDNLRHLRIEACAYAHEDHRLMRVLPKILDVPNLEKVEFMFDIMSEFFSCDIWTSWLCQKKREKLKEVDLRAWAVEDRLFRLSFSSSLRIICDMLKKDTDFKTFVITFIGNEEEDEVIKL